MLQGSFENLGTTNRNYANERNMAFGYEYQRTLKIQEMQKQIRRKKIFAS